MTNYRPMLIKYIELCLKYEIKMTYVSFWLFKTTIWRIIK